MKRQINRLAAFALTLGLVVSSAQLSVCAAAPTAEPLEATNGILSRLWPGRVPVTSMEPGEYQSTMTVGSTQLLSPVILPENASDKTLTVFSENPNIVAVNEQGYVGAVAVGSTRVGITCGDITVYYDITVTPDPSTVVTDMDVSISSAEIPVGQTANLSIAVMPTTATSTAEVSFASSNEGVATVNSFGRVTAIAPGKATITVTCGTVVRSVDVTVVVQTDGITVDSSYLVLKPGATHSIKASVTPASAPQSLTFSSLDPKVAKVTSSGVVQAVGTGSTTIVVSNGSSKAAITVIVNQGTTQPEDPDTPATPDTTQPSTDTAELAKQIEDAAPDAEITVAQSSLPVITTDLLMALHGTDKTLTVTSEAYTLSINGRDIKNAANELDTRFAFTETAEGLEFTLNGGSYMPGKVSIAPAAGTAATYQHLYLYNTVQEEWQKLNTYQNGVFTVDTAGRYLLTVKAFVTWGFSTWFIVGTAALVVVLVATYIVIKRRYWFW